VSSTGTSTGVDAPALEPRWRAYAAVYVGRARISVIDAFQYRAQNLVYLIGMVTEPVVYLVVWSIIARSHGGSLDGYTPGTFAAYYIVWMLVRNMNIVFTPYGWEQRIRTGELSAQLLRPLHPIHYDLSWFVGWKVFAIAAWIPIAVALSLLFHPTIDPTLAQVLTFLAAIWAAYLIRSLFMWALGLVTLWTTRVAALYDAYFTVELLFSGRLVPLALMPSWARTLSWVLPFRWAFGFPITSLVGPVTTGQLVAGLGMELAWIVAGSLLVAVVWKKGIRRYGAVGG
jgi:ABC-2 type transport system permease protein